MTSLSTLYVKFLLNSYGQTSTGGPAYIIRVKMSLHRSKHNFIIQSKNKNLIRVDHWTIADMLSAHFLKSLSKTSIKNTIIFNIIINIFFNKLCTHPLCDMLVTNPALLQCFLQLHTLVNNCILLLVPVEMTAQNWQFVWLVTLKGASHIRYHCTVTENIHTPP